MASRLESYTRRLMLCVEERSHTHQDNESGQQIRTSNQESGHQFRTTNQDNISGQQIRTSKLIRTTNQDTDSGHTMYLLHDVNDPVGILLCEVLLEVGQQTVPDAGLTPPDGRSEGRRERGRGGGLLSQEQHRP